MNAMRKILKGNVLEYSWQECSPAFDRAEKASLKSQYLNSETKKQGDMQTIDFCKWKFFTALLQKQWE